MALITNSNIKNLVHNNLTYIVLPINEDYYRVLRITRVFKKSSKFMIFDFPIGDRTFLFNENDFKEKILPELKYSHSKVWTCKLDMNKTLKELENGIHDGEDLDNDSKFKRYAFSSLF